MYRIMGRKSFDCIRIIYSIITLCLSIAAAYFSTFLPQQIWVKAPGIVSSAFSILTGFFLTVLTMSGNFDSALSTLSSTSLSSYQRTFNRRLERQVIGCLSCLITVIFSIVMEVCTISCQETWIRCIFIGVTVFSLFWSLSLPYTLYHFYKERYEYMIEQKKLSEERIKK